MTRKWLMSNNDVHKEFTHNNEIQKKIQKPALKWYKFALKYHRSQ